MSDSVTVDVANVRDWKKFQDYQGLKRMLRIHCFPIGERHGTLSISFFKHAQRNDPCNHMKITFEIV